MGGKITFPSIATTAFPVFYRTYSRWVDGNRETWEEVCDRSISGLTELGNLNAKEAALISRMQRQIKTLPSGRWLWVGGTEWIKKPENYSGAYNCTSTNITDWDSFGLMMSLAMMGCGTGAVLEPKYIDQLPKICNYLNVSISQEIGLKPKKYRLENTQIYITKNLIEIAVGDSRQGWVDSYQVLMVLSSTADKFNSHELDVHINLSNVRPAGEKLKGFGGVSNPIKLTDMYIRCANILNKALGRRLTAIECCLLIDEAAACVVAGNVRRSAGMRQFKSDDMDAADAKLNLWVEDNGVWKVDPERDPLRMANHTRVFHKKPTLEECIESVQKQYYSSEGAIQWAGEAKRRAGGEDRYGLNPCFVAGTLIATRNGHFPIEDLIGKTVEIHDGENWRLVDNFRITGFNQPVKKLKLHGGQEIIATPYHKFILEDGRSVELKDIQIGDRLKVNTESIQIDTGMEVQGAYLKGFLTGDGTHDHHNMITHLKVYDPKLVCVNRLIESIKEVGLKYPIGALISGHRVNYYGLTPSNHLSNLSQLHENLISWVTTNRWEFPTEILNCGLKSKLEYIAGIMDADGTAMDSKKGFGYQIMSIHEPWIKGFQLLLKTIGIDSKINPKREGGLKDFGSNRGSICRVQTIYRLSLPQKSSIKLAQLIKFERLNSFSNRSVKNNFRSNFAKVTEITNAGIADKVYCCTVPNTHTFTLTNSIISGNCGEIIGSDFHCNLAEVHLNQIDPDHLQEQDEAFEAGGLAVASLLNHEFTVERYQKSRLEDPIVGVSFTGLFDFFVKAFGVDWLKWWENGRPETNEGLEFKRREKEYLTRWRDIVHNTVWDYCNRNNLRQPNRCTTVQPAGTKSLLTGASPGWHPPKSQRFIRRITFAANDPVALTCIDYGYSVVPSQSDKDDDGNLLTNPFDPRCTEWLVELPIEVSWANMPGVDAIAIEKFSALAQFDFYMQVQQHYTTHNTSATIEFRESEIEALGTRIYEAIRDDEGYISAALMARFDDYQSHPLLPFEPISKDQYDEMVLDVLQRRTETDFHVALKAHDSGNQSEVGPAGCDSDKCLLPAK